MPKRGYVHPGYWRMFVSRVRELSDLMGGRDILATHIGVRSEELDYWTSQMVPTPKEVRDKINELYRERAKISRLRLIVAEDWLLAIGEIIGQLIEAIDLEYEDVDKLLEELREKCAEEVAVLDGFRVPHFAWMNPGTISYLQGAVTVWAAVAYYSPKMSYVVIEDIYLPEPVWNPLRVRPMLTRLPDLFGRIYEKADEMLEDKKERERVLGYVVLGFRTRAR